MMQTTPEQIAEVEKMRDRLADRFTVAENGGVKNEALTAVLTELTTLRALVAAADEVTTKAERLLKTFDDKTKRECSRPMFDAAIGLATAIEAFEALRER